ncbi:MAG: ATP-binding cassette domain-containing protein [Fretibacterium sp.]|nr:ATP-binding cassette domain-containing protein [Fretibacterium sp.]
MLELCSVSFSYDETRTALKDLSLKVGRGERVVILGHNGSGKSTLVKILGALQFPTQGTCFISGRDVRDIPFHDLRRQVGLVFQDPENQIVAAVVEDDVAFAPENQGLPSGEIQERVDWALERVGMRHKRNAPVSALSGGEKQRVALAGALAARVECLILDEPTAMLDPEGRLEIESVLRALHESGTTLVQVTHQLEILEDADRILVLDGGRLAWDGRTEDFWPLAGEMGFELPPLRSLALRLGLSAGAADVEKMASALAEFLPEHGGDLPVTVEASEKASGQPEKLIEVRSLSFQFDAPGGPWALRDVDADISRGSWLSVVGRTGSGKSTLIQHLNGLYKIQAGKIHIEGEPLPQKGEALHALRQRVGLVFQCPEDQFFSPTVEEELAFAPKNAGLSGEELKDAVMDALDHVGLGRDFLPRNPLLLSGGERRLVAIASVLAAGPECLALDEPLAGLDAAYRSRVLALLSELRDEGKTIITITHDWDMALQFSSRVLVMQDGQSLAQGTPREVLPSLMAALSPDAWPEIVRLSSVLRQRFPFVPLTWDAEELIPRARQSEGGGPV